MKRWITPHFSLCHSSFCLSSLSRKLTRSIKRNASSSKIPTALTSDIGWSMQHHEWVKLWSHIRRRCSKRHFWSLYTVTVTSTTRQHWIMAMLLLLLVINISCILIAGITFNYGTPWKNTHHKTLGCKMQEHLTRAHFCAANKWVVTAKVKPCLYKHNEPQDNIYGLQWES